MKNRCFSLLIITFIISAFILPEINIEEHIFSINKIKSSINHSEELSYNIKDFDFGLNGIALLKSTHPELDGSGINIAQKENRPESTDLDISSSLLQSFLESSSSTTHATQVATIMVGRGITSPLNEGVVPNAKLYSVSFDKSSPESDSFYIQNNITVVNNSFGTEIEPFYGKNAVEYDAITQRNPNLLFVFSAGNIGYSNSDIGKYANIRGFANITGNYKMAKNILTVGAIDQFQIIKDVSSVGPAYDGRIKPEVVVFSNNGTSQAAALASGIAAMVQQFYQKKYHQLPSSALLKALLVNSAEDVGAVGIDHKTGFGSLNVSEAVHDIEMKTFWENTLQNKEQKSISIDIPENIDQLKVSLVWSDTPADFNASKALVNDLDLSLTMDKAPFTIWQPWVLSNFPHKDSLQKIPVRKQDNLNNIEQITLDKPKAGQYKIQVNGNKIVSNAQSFAVAYRMQMSNQFSWIFPVKDSRIKSDLSNIIRWKSTLTNTKGKLEYSLNQGKTWITINSDVDIKTGYYEWETPNIFSDVILRLATNDKAFLSDIFVISPVIQANSQFFCSDSTQLYWNEPQFNKDVKYNIYKLDKRINSWKKLTTVEQQSNILIGTNQNDSFSVEPVMPSGKTGIRSDILNTQTLGVSCYYNDFTTIVEDEKGRLAISLTTTVGIKNLSFQKITNFGNQNILTIPVEQNINNYVAYDEHLYDGINKYQVEINFLNGKTIYTTVSLFFFSESNNFWIYPTPLKANEILTIQSNLPEVSSFTLSNALGSTVFEQPIYYGSNQLILPYLPAGNYYFQIHNPESLKLKKGKITVIQ